MSATWGTIGIGLLVLLPLLVITPVAVIVLLLSPDARRVMVSLLTRLAPVAVGVLLLAVLLTPTQVVIRQQSSMQAGPPPQPVPPAEPPSNAELLSGHETPLPAPALTPSQIATNPAVVVHSETAQLPIWLLAAVSLLALGGIAAVCWPRHRPMALAALMFGGIALGFISLFSVRDRQVVLETSQQHYEQSLHAEQVRRLHEQAVSDRLAAEARRSGSTSGAEAGVAAGPSDILKPVSIVSFATGSDRGVEVDALPAWVNAGSSDHLAGDEQQLVLVSQRYATTEEAEADLLAQLRPRLARYVESESVSAADQLTLVELQRAGVVKDRVEEKFLVDLGSAQAPVYRMTWQVAFTPVAREVIAAQHLQELQNTRLWQLGLGAGLLTLLFGAWAAYFRVDESTQGRYRGRLKLAAISASLAIAGAVLAV